jgi:hypothetical protein
MYRKGSLKSITHVRDICVTQLLTANCSNYSHVDILSAHNNLLIIAQRGRHEFFIYNSNGSYLQTLPAHNSLLDITWTPHGNIVYSTLNYTVTTISGEGTDMAKTQLSLPQQFSVSADGAIYLSEVPKGLYRSCDDGMNWTLVFESPDSEYPVQAIKVSSPEQQHTVFWTVPLVVSNGQMTNGTVKHTHYLRVFDKMKVGLITLPPIESYVDPRLSEPRLAFDKHSTVFLTRGGLVYTLPTDYHLRDDRQRQPLALIRLSNDSTAWFATVDSLNDVLYVGKSCGVVGVYNLTYDLNIA